MIDFNKGSRFYNCRGGEPVGMDDTDLRVARKLNLFPSITTLDKSFFKNEGLEKYAKNQLAQAAYAYPRMEHETEETYCNRIYQLSLEHSKKAANFGSEVHEAIDHYPQMPLNPDLYPWMERFGAWYDKNIGDTIAAEKVMVDHDLGVAGRCDRVCIHKPTGRRMVPDWKGLALDTPIPTPLGWSNMGALKEGDYILGAKGGVTRIIGKSEIFNRKCYRLVFDDKTSIVCDNVHLWMVNLRRKNKKSIETVSTDKVSSLINEGWKITIPNCDPILVSENWDNLHLPIDPYVLGVWLGDGCEKEPKISISDVKIGIVPYFEQQGLEIAPMKTKRSDGGRGFYIKNFVGILKDAGLFGNKHIPQSYMRASAFQRLMLLRGLMDTDGSWNKTRNQADFTSTDEKLADSVYELVVSLGWRAYKWSGEGFGFGKKVNYFRITFTPFDANPFLFNSRNQPLCQDRIDGTLISRRRMVLSVQEIDSVPTQCIFVDAQDSLYLAGKQMIPTHNTQGVSKNPKGKKTPGFYDSWVRQLAFYAVCDAKEQGVYPQQVPMVMSVVIDSNEPDDPFVKIWDDEEVKLAYEEVSLASYHYFRKRNFWPHLGERPSISFSVKQPYQNA